VSATQTGLIFGLALGLAASQGFLTFLITLVFGCVGWVIGRMIDGKSWDMSGMFGPRDR